MSERKDNKTLIIILNDTKSDSSNFILQLLKTKKLKNYHIHVTGLKLCQDEEFLSDIVVLKDLNHRLFLYKTDITSDISVNQMFDEIMKIEKKIDVLVCNVNEPSYHHSTTQEQQQDRLTYLYEQNFYPHVYVISTAVRYMKHQEEHTGQILVINNHAGQKGLAYYAEYCSTRFAIEGFLESVAAEVMCHKIKVTIIETAISKEDFISVDTVGTLLNGHETHHNNETRKELVLQQLETIKLIKTITSEKLIKCILDIISRDKNDFRYYANKSCEKYAKETRVDPKGTTKLSEVARFFLNLDIDDIRLENEVLTTRKISSCSLNLRNKILS